MNFSEIVDGFNSRIMVDGNLYSTALGFSALPNSFGVSNTGMGHETLTSNTSGYRNTAMGVQALATNSTGNLNTAVGFWALKNNNGAENTALGDSALLNNTDGIWNTAVGRGAMYNNERCALFASACRTNLVCSCHKFSTSAEKGLSGHAKGLADDDN